MRLDRFKFRAWIEIPLTGEDGEEFNFNLCLYGVDVLSDGNFAGFYEWLLGDTLSEIKLTDKQKDEVWRFCEDNNIFNSETYYCIPTDKIEQCIGLNDNSGKWIFEGDILYFYYEWGPNQECATEGKGQVIFSQEEAEFVISAKSDYLSFGNIDTQIEVEIIGNIHENKNLLEVENNGSAD